MNPQPAAYRYWRALTLIGACLIAVGLGAGYFDEVSHFAYSFISDFFDVFGWMMLIGVLLVFIGSIGWAKHLGKQRRVLMALAVFSAPWAVLLLGYPIAGANSHGPAAFVMMLMIPATILTVVLLIMAGLKPTEKT